MVILFLIDENPDFENNRYIRRTFDRKKRNKSSNNGHQFKMKRLNILISISLIIDCHRFSYKTRLNNDYPDLYIVLR